MLSPRFKLSELLTNLVKVSKTEDCEIQSITLDSREVTSGCLFVALNGVNQHGLAYAEKAVELGAVAILWESGELISVPDLPVPSFEVKNLRDYLGVIADRFYLSPSRSLDMVGITGTDGKTSVSHFLAQANERCGVIGTIGLGSLNDLTKAKLTTPDVLTVHKNLAQMKQQGIEMVAMEVSSHALDQGRVANVDFDVAVLTNLSRDHLDYHKTVEAYADAKEKLFTWSSLKAVVLNLDDDFGLKIAKSRGGVLNIQSRDKPNKVALIAYGIGAVSDYPAGSLVATQSYFNNDGINATIKFGEQTGQLSAKVLGRFNLSNLLATVGAMIALGQSLDEALAKLNNVKTVSGRMEKIESGKANFLTVIDFAHTPNALSSVLQALREHTENKLICVFGCGGDRDAGKRPQMAKIAEQNADIVIVTDDNPRSENPEKIVLDILSGFTNPTNVTVEHDRAAAIKLAISRATAGDAVLIAGKGHETEQILADGVVPFNDGEQASKCLQELAA